MKTLEAGDQVMIYEDPHTRKSKEGLATLVTKDEDLGGDADEERWAVRFGHELDTYERLIVTSEAGAHDEE